MVPRIPAEPEDSEFPPRRQPSATPGGPRPVIDGLVIVPNRQPKIPPRPPTRRRVAVVVAVSLVSLALLLAVRNLPQLFGSWDMVTNLSTDSSPEGQFRGFLVLGLICISILGAIKIAMNSK